MARTTVIKTKAKARLSDVKLSEISLVGKGDNKGAHVMLLKTKPADEIPTIVKLGKNYKGKDKFQVLKDWFEATQHLEKDALTFAQIIDNKEIKDKIWSMVWTLEDSISSIMNDDDCADKATMIQQSIEEFKSAVTPITKGEENMTAEEMKKALEASEAKVAELEKQLGEVQKEVEVAKAKPAAGEVCKTCGQTMPVKKEAEIDKSALPEAVVKQLEAIEKQNAENQAVIAKMQDDTLTTTSITKAAAIPAVGASAELSDLLKSLSKADQSLCDKVYGVLKAADAKIKAGGLFKELGSSEGGESTAAAKLDKAAAEIRKEQPKLTKEQAWVKAYDADKELAAQYNAESR